MKPRLHAIALGLLFALTSCSIANDRPIIDCRDIAVTTDDVGYAYLWDARTLRRYSASLRQKLDDFEPYDASDDINGTSPNFAIVRPGVVQRPFEFGGGFDLIDLNGAAPSIERFVAYGTRGRRLSKHPSPEDFRDDLQVRVIGRLGSGDTIGLDERERFQRIWLDRSGVFRLRPHGRLDPKYLMGLHPSDSGMAAGSTVGYVRSYDDRGVAHLVIYDFASERRGMLFGSRTQLPNERDSGAAAADRDDNLYVLDNGRRKRILVYARGSTGNAAPTAIIDLPMFEKETLENIALDRSMRRAYLVTFPGKALTSGTGNVAHLHVLELFGNRATAVRSVAVPIYCNTHYISL